MTLSEGGKGRGQLLGNFLFAWLRIKDFGPDPRAVTQHRLLNLKSQPLFSLTLSFILLLLLIFILGEGLKETRVPVPVELSHDFHFLPFSDPFLLILILLNIELFLRYGLSELLRSLDGS